jgi:hypothetical protein
MKKPGGYGKELQSLGPFKVNQHPPPNIILSKKPGKRLPKAIFNETALFLCLYFFSLLACEFQRSYFPSKDAPASLRLHMLTALFTRLRFPNIYLRDRTLFAFALHKHTNTNNPIHYQTSRPTPTASFIPSHSFHGVYTSIRTRYTHASGNYFILSPYSL